MKLWEVTNGFMGNGYLSVLIIARTKKRALELAGDAFKKDADNGGLNLSYSDKPRYPESYWTNLEAELLCGDVNNEYVGYITD